MVDLDPLARAFVALAGVAAGFVVSALLSIFIEYGAWFFIAPVGLAAVASTAWRLMDSP